MQMILHKLQLILVLLLILRGSLRKFILKFRSSAPVVLTC